MARIDRRIRFFLRCDDDYIDFISDQLYAHFPSILIRKHEEYIPSNIMVAHATLQSLDTKMVKLYLDFNERTEKEDIDPLSALTAALSGVNTDETDVIRINFSPRHDKTWNSEKRQRVFKSKTPEVIQSWWLKRYPPIVAPFAYFGLRILSAPWLRKNPEEQEDKWKPKGANKFEENGFDVSIQSIVPGEKINTTSLRRIKDLCHAFHIYALPGSNKFSFTKPKTATREQLLNTPWKTSLLNTLELAWLVHVPTKYVSTPGIDWVMSQTFEPPHNIPLATEEWVNPIGITNFRSYNKNFWIRTEDRLRHAYIIGKTGMGKSTLLENMIVEDILKWRWVGVIDPHGDLAQKIISCVPKSRTNDVIYFNPADSEHPVALNLFEDVEPHLRPVIASGIVNIFKKMFENSWWPRLEYILRNSILTLLETPDSTFMDLFKLLTKKSYRERKVEKLDDPVLLKFWTDEFGKWSPHQVNEAIAPIMNKIGQFLSNPIIRHIIGQKKNTFSIRWAMDNKKILVFNLSKWLIGEDASTMLGAMLVTKFQIDAMSRANVQQDDRVNHFLYVDEFQNFATGSFGTILSEARKYKLSLTMANQYIEQMSEEVRWAVFGNVWSIFSFQVGHEDAKILAPAFWHEDFITPQDLLNLPKYQLYARLLIDGMPSQVFSADSHPPIDISAHNFQEYDKIVSSSRQRFSKNLAKVKKSFQ